METEDFIKRKAAPKDKPLQGPEGQKLSVSAIAHAEGEEAPPTKPILPAKITMFEKNVQKINKLLETLSGQVLAASAEDMKDFVPRYHLSQATKIVQELQDSKQLLQKWIKDKEGVPTQVADFVKLYKASIKTWEEMAEKINDLLEDAERATAMGGGGA